MRMTRLPLLATCLVAAAFLAPVAADACGAPKTAQTAWKPAGPTIVEVAVNAGQFNTLVAAVKAAGLVDTLQGEGPFTVFAPTDAAFAALPAGTVEGLLANPKQLAEVLTYHVVPGTLKAEDISDLRRARTVQGQRVTFEMAHGGLTVNGAKVVSADIAASNGVIHVIDHVILPAQAAGQ